MTTITIDEIPYELEKLSEGAKQQIIAVQFIDAEMQRLNAQAAVLQTARVAYVNALKNSLPKA